MEGPVHSVIPSCVLSGLLQYPPGEVKSSPCGYCVNVWVIPGLPSFIHTPRLIPRPSQFIPGLPRLFSAALNTYIKSTSEAAMSSCHETKTRTQLNVLIFVSMKQKTRIYNV